MNDCSDELASCASLCTMEERETALLSVSVTFKPQESLETDANNSETKIPDQTEGKGHCVGHNNGNDEESLQRTTSSGTITSSERKVKTKIKAKNEAATKAEILLGWKGFSNSIYIQPIIVNSPVNQENKTCFKSGKSTVEQLRQQLRLRQSSEWVVKHNQKIHLKGSLKTGVPNVNPEINTCISHCHSSSTIKENKKVGLPQHSYPIRKTSKLAKGFVCRHWTRDFLSNENESEQESETSSLTIRSYVNVNMMDMLLKTTKATAQKKGVCPDVARSQQPENVRESSPDCNADKGHQASRRSSLSSSLVSSEVIPKDNLHQDITDLIFGNISVSVPNSCMDEACSCRLNSIEAGSQASKTQGKEMGKARTMNMLRPKQETRIFMPVPLKEFPPIDPLRDLKKSSIFQTMGKRKLPRRPHTVGTPCSFSNGNEKKKAGGSRILSSKSLDSHFCGIHGRAVNQQARNWENQCKPSKTVVLCPKP